MPLFEYRCRQCQHAFEALVRSTSDGASGPTCPACQSGELEKLLSVFAVNTGALPVMACGSGQSCQGPCAERGAPGECLVN